MKTINMFATLMFILMLLNMNAQTNDSNTNIYSFDPEIPKLITFQGNNKLLIPNSFMGNDNYKGRLKLEVFFNSSNIIIGYNINKIYVINLSEEQSLICHNEYYDQIVNKNSYSDSLLPLFDFVDSAVKNLTIEKNKDYMDILDTINHTHFTYWLFNDRYYNEAWQRIDCYEED